MARTLLLAMLIGRVLGDAAVHATTKLVVTNRPSRNAARLTYSSSDAQAGLSKGAGTDADGISVEAFVAVDGATSVFEVPAGHYDGQHGWLANDATRAIFSNRTPPDPTGVDRTVLATGKRLTLRAKSLGDRTPLVLGGPPSGAVRLAYVVSNGGESATHCTQFTADQCTYAMLDHGSGYKLRCTGGAADPACSARPTCGNGVVEPGEQCDGGPLCTPACLQGLASCCEGGGVCASAPVFSLVFYVDQYCNAQGFGANAGRPGLVCQPDGSCADVAIDPVQVCCQKEGPACSEGPVTTVGGLWYAQYGCLQGSGIGGPRHIVVNASCGADGNCVPN